MLFSPLLSEFNVHIANLIRKLKGKIFFPFRNESSFSVNSKKNLHFAFFMMIHCVHAASSVLMCHASLQFIPNANGEFTDPS